MVCDRFYDIALGLLISMRSCAPSAVPEAGAEFAARRVLGVAGVPRADARDQEDFLGRTHPGVEVLLVQPAGRKGLPEAVAGVRVQRDVGQRLGDLRPVARAEPCMIQDVRQQEQLEGVQSQTPVSLVGALGHTGRRKLAHLARDEGVVQPVPSVSRPAHAALGDG